MDSIAREDGRVYLFQSQGREEERLLRQVLNPLLNTQHFPLH